MECLEVFARHRTLPNFDLYGNELKPLFQPAAVKLDSELNQLEFDKILIEERTQKIMDYFLENNPE